jgi:hypothetical protein
VRRGRSGRITISVGKEVVEQINSQGELQLNETARSAQADTHQYGRTLDNGANVFHEASSTDQLMTAEFSPVNSTAYLTALRQQLKDVPPNPKEQVVISRHTNFIYYANPDGSMRFIWEDSKLSKEWKAWVKANS